MLTNQAFEAIIDFLSNTESADITSENYIPWDDAALLFLALSEPYFKELRGNLLNLNREDASLYLCEAIESLSRFSNLILPANDEIDALLALQEKHKTLGLVIEQAYSEALKEAFTVVCREELPKEFTEAIRSGTVNTEFTEFKVDLGTEFFRGEELALRRDFRIELHRRFSNGSFNPDTMPEDGWAWIYAEQVSFFLESIWLRVIELYERRCGTAPEALHWHSYSQWVKQHSQETEQLAASEAILIALLTYGDDKPIEAILIELAYDADESVLASNTTFNAGKTDYSAPIDTADAPATTEPPQSGSLHLDTPAPTVAALSPTDRILGAGFTLEDADQLAYAVGVTNEAGNYKLGPRKLGAVVGFCLALQQANKLTGAISTLTAVLAPRWGVIVATRKTTTSIAQHYFNLTNKALARPKKTD